MNIDFYNKIISIDDVLHDSMVFNDLLTDYGRSHVDDRLGAFMYPQFGYGNNEIVLWYANYNLIISFGDIVKWANINRSEQYNKTVTKLNDIYVLDKIK